MLVEEGTYISNHKVELLNSKNQVKVIRTTTRCQAPTSLRRRSWSWRMTTRTRARKLEALSIVENFL